MNRSTSVRAVHGPRVATVLLATFFSLVAFDEGVAHSSSASMTAAVKVPLSTVLTTASGDWATLPMGHLDQPLNTFWQLVLRPVGQSRWTDETKLAVATNGGLVLATSGGSELLVATRPSNLLYYSPLASTSSAGHNWASSPPVQALVARTDALAEGAGGDRWALVEHHGSERVLEAPAGANTWTTLTSQSVLAATSGGRTCGVSSLTSLLAEGGGVLVGGTCSQRGQIALFARDGVAWHRLDLNLSGALARGTTTVLGMRVERRGICVLLADRVQGSLRIVAAVTSGPNGPWRIEPGPSLPSGAAITSIGPSVSGMFVLWNTKAGPHLSTMSGAGTWTTLPTPPKGTATASFGPSSMVQTLSVSDTVLKVFALSDGGQWKKIQTMNVPIQFGSSG